MSLVSLLSAKLKPSGFREELVVSRGPNVTLFFLFYLSLEEEKKLILTPFERNLEFWRQLWRVIERR